MSPGAGGRAALGASVLALAAGLLLGPGYFVYANVFSGSLVAERQVYERSADGVTPWNQPFEFELSPEMNPVAVVARLQILPDAAPRRRTSQMEVTLQRGETPVWRETASVLRAETDSRSESRSEGEPTGTTSAVEHLAIRRFEVAEAAAYGLSAALLEPQEVTIGAITLQVRRNVMETSLALMVGGFGCLLLGIFGLMIALRRRQRGRRV